MKQMGEKIVMKKNILEIIIIIILIAILTVLMLLFLKVNKTTDKDIIEDNTATMWDNEDNSVNVSDDNKEVIEEDTNPENKKIIAEYSYISSFLLIAIFTISNFNK